MFRLVTTVFNMDTPEQLALAVSNEVRVEMRLKKISQRELAASTNIPLVTLNRRLTGGKPFDLAEVALIAHALEVDVIELLLRAAIAAEREALKKTA